MKERSQRKERVPAVLATRRADEVQCVYARGLGPLLGLAGAQVIAVGLIFIVASRKELSRRWRSQNSGTIFVTLVETFIGRSTMDRVAKSPHSTEEISLL